MKQIILFSAFVLLISACKKAPEAVISDNTGNVRLDFKNMAGNSPLVLKDQWYVNENKDSLKITFFAYYVSNVSLINENGTEYAIPDSYFFINEKKESSKTYLLENIPEATYTKISFLIGVDSAHNVAGAQTGALDPSNGMFWDWNSGYIMAKIEGESPQAPLGLMYHIGGFEGSYSCLRKVTLDLPQGVTIKKNSTPAIHMSADALEWFKTPNTIKIDELSFFNNPGSNAALIADNYADMFMVTSVD